MSAAVIPRRCVTLAATRTRSGTLSSSRSSQERTGAGVMSTKPTSESEGGPDSAEGGQITDHGTVAARATGQPGSRSSGCGRQKEGAVMPVMGFTKFERFFRAAAAVQVDRDDVKRYLDFVNDAIYGVLLIGQ